MSSQYIKCDMCGVTLGAEQVIKDRHVGFGDTPELLREAVLLGWTIMDGKHICRDCSKENRGTS